MYITMAFNLGNGGPISSTELAELTRAFNRYDRYGRKIIGVHILPSFLTLGKSYGEGTFNAESFLLSDGTKIPAPQLKTLVTSGMQQLVTLAKNKVAYQICIAEFFDSPYNEVNKDDPEFAAKIMERLTTDDGHFERLLKNSTHLNKYYHVQEVAEELFGKRSPQ